MDTVEFCNRFDDLQRPLMAFALKLTHNFEDARDLVQETGCRAYGHLDNFQFDTNFKAWVTVIMRNTFINDYRKRKRRGMWIEGIDEVHHRNMSVKNNAVSDMTFREIRKIVNNIESGLRIPFMLYYQGYKYEEISEELNMPLGTVKSRIFFARKKLREHLGVEYAS